LFNGKITKHVTRINLVEKAIIALFLLILFSCSHSGPSERGPFIQVSDSGLGLLITKRITEWRTSSNKAIGGEPIYSAVLVESFYKGRNYQPAWSQGGRLMQAETLIKAVDEAYGDGLTPDYYHLGLIRPLVNKVEKGSFPDPMLLADLDILLTDAFLTLGCHLSGGCVNPVTMETEWFTKRRNVDVSHVLEQALKKKQIREALMRLRPGQASYDRLRQSLARCRELLSKGEWPQVSTGPLLEKGSMSDRVVELRKRLAASGDLEADEANGGDLFDAKLKQSVITFQKRHGLKADGSVGPATLNAINIPLKERIRQIELNLERLRWILGNVEQRSIVVNIANFELSVIENGKSILSMKVVVGKRYWDTPVFTAKMTDLIINPSWNVPDSIARREILKAIKKDPHYLTEQNIKVLRGWGPREEEIDPETIDWSEVTAKTLIYRFRQEPGPLNPLGQLKFMFPNKFDVYLHDTPAKRLFSENVRAFSHGCTRIEKPIELGEYVLRDDPRWSREKLQAAIDEGVEQNVRIAHPLNVHFLYLTAWVDDSGTLQFRNDIYGRDTRLDEALRKKPSFQ
jgi:murein L,D-transpeptidase YcbB/YkuD